MELKRVVVAIDSFKGSISSRVAGEAAVEAIKSVCPACIITVYPLADGGEGTVDALCDGLGGEIIETDVTGPLGSKVKSRYGYLPAQHTAIIEMADAAGLAMVPPGRRNPLYTTTYGLGYMARICKMWRRQIFQIWLQCYLHAHFLSPVMLRTR